MAEQAKPKGGGYLQALKNILTNRNFLLLILIRASYSIATELNKTTISKFGAAVGASAAVLGVVASLYSITQMISRPISGRIIDRLNQKKVLISTFILYILVNILYVFTSNVPLYIFDRMLYGFASVFVMTSMGTVVGASVDKKAMGTAFGVYLFMPKAVSAIVPVLSVNIYNTMGPNGVFYGSAAFCALCAVLSCFIRVEDASKLYRAAAEKAGKIKFKLSNFIAFESLPAVGMRFFTSFLFTLTQTYLVLHGDELGIENAAIYFSMYTLLSMWGGIVGGPLYDKLGMDFIIFPMLGGAAAATLFCGFATSATHFMLAGIAFGFTYGMSNPACSAAAIAMASPERRGIATATNLLVPDVCSVVTGFLIGYLADAFGYAATFRVMVVFPILGFIFYLFSRRKIQNAISAKTDA